MEKEKKSVEEEEEEGLDGAETPSVLASSVVYVVGFEGTTTAAALWSLANVFCKRMPMELRSWLLAGRVAVRGRS